VFNDSCRARIEYAVGRECVNGDEARNPPFAPFAVVGRRTLFAFGLSPLRLKLLSGEQFPVKAAHKGLFNVNDIEILELKNSEELRRRELRVQGSRNPLTRKISKLVVIVQQQTETFIEQFEGTNSGSVYAKTM